MWNCYSTESFKWQWLAAENEMMRTLCTLFGQVQRSVLTLRELREKLRDDLAFTGGINFPCHGPRMTAIDRVLDTCFMTTMPHAQRFRFCKHCGYVGTVQTTHSPLWSTGLYAAMRVRRVAVPSGDLFANLIGDNSRGDCLRCTVRGTLFTGTWFSDPPPFLLLEVPTDDTRFPALKVDRSISININDTAYTWSLFGVIYLAHAHFTARFIKSDSRIWYHDGIETGEDCTEESSSCDFSRAHDARACILLYWKD